MLAQPYDRGSPKLLGELEALTRQQSRRPHPHAARRRQSGARTTEKSGGPLRQRIARRQVNLASRLHRQRPRRREMTEHLIALGHRRIAHVTGQDEYATSVQRPAGYAKRSRRRASRSTQILSFQAVMISQWGGGRRGAVARDDPPTAIFAASDEMAAGALTAAHRAGWQSLTTSRSPVLATMRWRAMSGRRSPPCASRCATSGGMPPTIARKRGRSATTAPRFGRPRVKLSDKESAAPSASANATSVAARITRSGRGPASSKSASGERIAVAVTAAASSPVATASAPCATTAG